MHNFQCLLSFAKKIASIKAIRSIAKTKLDKSCCSGKQYVLPKPVLSI